MGIIAGFMALRMVRRILKLVMLLVAVLVAYLAVTAVQVWLTSRHSDPHQAGAIVVMGAAQYNGVPSPDFGARLDEAYALWNEHLAPVIVVTGSKEPGDNYTEAETGATYLAQKSPAVPAADVIQAGGSDSWANLATAAPLLHQRGITTVLLVTDAFHEARSLAIATDVGLQASPVPAVGSPIRGFSVIPYFAKETVGVAIGRILGFNHLETLHRALHATRSHRHDRHPPARRPPPIG